jgi:hypothetical protein
MKKLLTILMLCGVCYGYAQKTPPHAASTRTWVIKANGVTQTWSDHIDLPACNKARFEASSTRADCRNNPGYHYLYSWLYVKQNAATLCPSPWRVPTVDDFEIVVANPGNWGAVLGGYVSYNGSRRLVGYLGYYASCSVAAQNKLSSWTLSFPPLDFLQMSSDWGASVRCVK